MCLFSVAGWANLSVDRGRTDVEEEEKKMRNSKAVYGMNLVPVFALAVILLLPLGLGAQEGNSESQAGRLEGMWRLQITVRDCQTGAGQGAFPALFSFSKGGILNATSAGLPSASTTPHCV